MNSGYIRIELNYWAPLGVGELVGIGKHLREKHPSCRSSSALSPLFPAAPFSVWNCKSLNSPLLLGSFLFLPAGPQEEERWPSRSILSHLSLSPESKLSGNNALPRFLSISSTGSKSIHWSFESHCPALEQLSYLGGDIAWCSRG